MASRPGAAGSRRAPARHPVRRSGVEDVERTAERVPDEYVRAGHVGHGEQVVELGHHRGGVTGHRRRAAAAWAGRLGQGRSTAGVRRRDHRSGPVVDADPALSGESSNTAGAAVSLTLQMSPRSSSPTAGPPSGSRCRGTQVERLPVDVHLFGDRAIRRGLTGGRCRGRRPSKLPRERAPRRAGRVTDR